MLNKIRRNSRPRALMLGNGINLVSTTISWKSLLSKISDVISPGIDTHNPYKPFPLLFEEIILKCEYPPEEAIKKAKTVIADIFKEIETTSIHESLVTCGIKDILTTNYDYSLELACNSHFYSSRTRMTSSEFKHSLHRKHQFERLNIWHIHGELNNGIKIIQHPVRYPAMSIMIGHEHYADYFNRIQEYTRKPDPKISKSLLKAIHDGEHAGSCWIDLFITHDIYVIGFGFDFSENHLWWLLNFRALKKTKWPKTIQNKIHFLYPPHELLTDTSKPAKSFREKLMLKAKIDLFNALNVLPIEIPAKSLNEFYVKAIKEVIK